MKKSPKYLSLIGFAMMVWGTFLVPSVNAGAPVYDTFDSYNFVGWSFALNDMLATTSPFCVSNGCVTSTGNSATHIIRKTDLPYGSGGFRVYYRGTGGGTTFNVVLDEQTAPLGGPYRISFTDAPGDSVQHYVDVAWQMIGTTTQYDFYKDGVLSIQSGVFASTTPLIYDTVALAIVTSGGFWGYFDELGGFGGSAPVAYNSLLVNPSYISTTTSQQYCSGIGTSSSGFLDSIAASISVGFCNASVFLFIPSQTAVANLSSLSESAKQKIPFSYFYSLYGQYSTLSASSTENLPTWSLTLPAFGSSTPLGTIIPTEITFLSTSTISTYYPDGIRHTFLFLGQMAIWFGLAWALYHRIIPHKPTL